jgi:hypothetical protein
MAVIQPPKASKNGADATKKHYKEGSNKAVRRWKETTGGADVKWLGILDSNQGYLIQSQAAYR